MKHHILQITNQDKGGNWLQIVAILVGSLAVFYTGLFFAWPSPFILKISSDKVNYDITEKEASYFTILPHLMTLLSCPLFSKLCDIIGRKRTIMLVIIPQVSVLLLKWVANSVYVFYLARCMVGIGDGIVFAALPMYIAEISTPHIRGSWGNAFVFFFFFGFLCMNIIGIYFSVQQTSYICTIVPITFAALFPMMPESPYFYLMKGREMEAQASLKRLRQTENIEIEFNILREDVVRQMSESGTWSDLVNIKSNRKALIAGIFIRISQQASGISVFGMYTKYIFDTSGTNIDTSMSTILYVGLSCIMTLVGTLTVDRLGRKNSYIFSLSFCSIALAVLSVYFYINQFFPEIDLTCLQWIPLAGMIWFVLFSSLGLGIVPNLLVGELFSTSIKSKGLTILIIAYGLSNSMASYIFYYLRISFGFYSPFLFFAIGSVISIFLSMHLIPETSGKTLEQIQQTLKGGIK